MRLHRLAVAAAVFAAASPSLATDSPAPGWYHEQKSVSLAPGQLLVVEVLCPLGTEIISGGYSVSAPPGGFEVNSSTPAVKSQGWYVSGFNTSDVPRPIVLDVIARCTPPVAPPAVPAPD